MEDECVILKGSMLEDPLSGIEPEMERIDFEPTDKDEVIPTQMKVVEIINRKWRKGYKLPEPEDLKISCPECGRWFLSESGLATHKRLKHSDYTPWSLNGRRRKKNKPCYGDQKYRNRLKSRSHQVQLFRCEKCQASVKNLHFHMRNHHPQNTFQCELCDMKLNGINPYNRHLRNVHPREAPIYEKKIEKPTKKNQQKILIKKEKVKYEVIELEPLPEANGVVIKQEPEIEICDDENPWACVKIKNELE